MAKKNYYAVKKGKTPGIYRTWDACKAQVHGYPGAIYKGFEHLADAEEFLGENTESKMQKNVPEKEKNVEAGAEQPEKAERIWDWKQLVLEEKTCTDPEYILTGKKAVAYVDGSYYHAVRKFSCGVVLFFDGKEICLAEAYDDADLASMRNVAGEVKGAELAMAYCLTHGISELTIYHDYQGIASWCTREWQAKKQGTMDYRDFYDTAAKEVSIRFCKVKGHTGVTYNEKADQLAKYALGIQ